MAKRKGGDGQGRRKELAARRDSHEGAPSRDEFAGRLMEAIRRAGETRPIRYDPDGFTLVSQKGEYHLRNAFRAYCIAKDRARTFGDAVAIWFADMRLPEKYEDVNPDLLPKVVRRTEYDASLLERNGDGGEARGSMPWLIADHLAVVAAYDLPDCIVTLMPHGLLQGGASPTRRRSATPAPTSWKSARARLRTLGPACTSRRGGTTTMRLACC